MKLQGEKSNAEEFNHLTLTRLTPVATLVAVVREIDFRDGNCRAWQLS